VNITSMMDMMTIILVFLLNSFSAEPLPVSASERLELPVAQAHSAPVLAVQVVLSQEDVRVDGEPVLRLSPVADPVTGLPSLAFEDEAEAAAGLPTFRARLAAKAARLVQTGQDAAGAEVHGKLLVTSDASIPYGVLKSVLYAAGEEGFGDFQFLVRQRGP
jgi:biopolymer transport protein ExbD